MTHYSVHRPWTRSPFGGLLNELRRELGSPFRASDAAFAGHRGVYPPVNLHERDGDYVLTAEMPGVSPDDIDVSIEGATVTLSGQRKAEYEAGNGTAVHRRERQFGNFRRAFELPSEIDLDGAKATHKNGVLRLELPKSAAARPRQIEIETR